MSTPHNGGMYCGPCYVCKSEMWLPKELHDAAKRSDTIVFYCAYGHRQVFTKGDSDLDVMRRERDRLQQQLAERDDTIKLLDERVEAAKRFEQAAARAKKRTAAGTCPCCKRTFRQMALHMRNAHPNYFQGETE